MFKFFKRSASQISESPRTSEVPPAEQLVDLVNPALLADPAAPAAPAAPAEPQAEQPADRGIYENCIPMCQVLARLEREGVLGFFKKARDQSAVPKKTFEEVERLVVSLGCTPAQCIHVNAQQWLSPNGRTTNQGANRHQAAGTMLRHVIKHLQRACSKCGAPHGHLMT